MWKHISMSTKFFFLPVVVHIPCRHEQIYPRAQIELFENENWASRCMYNVCTSIWYCWSCACVVCLNFPNAIALIVPEFRNHSLKLYHPVVCNPSGYKGKQFKSPSDIRASEEIRDETIIINIMFMNWTNYMSIFFLCSLSVFSNAIVTCLDS